MLTVAKCVAAFFISLTLASLMFYGLHQIARINEAKADAVQVIFAHIADRWATSGRKVCHATP